MSQFYNQKQILQSESNAPNLQSEANFRQSESNARILQSEATFIVRK